MQPTLYLSPNPSLFLVLLSPKCSPWTKNISKGKFSGPTPDLLTENLLVAWGEAATCILTRPQGHPDTGRSLRTTALEGPEFSFLSQDYNDFCASMTLLVLFHLSGMIAFFLLYPLPPTLCAFPTCPIPVHFPRSCLHCSCMKSFWGPPGQNESLCSSNSHHCCPAWTIEMYLLLPC